MRRPRLLWRLFPPILMATLLPLIAVSWFSLGTLRSFHVRRIRADLEDKGLLLRGEVLKAIEAGDQQGLQDLAARVLSDTGTRVTVVFADGKVAADSSAKPDRMDLHDGRPEIASAMLTGRGYSTRRSATLRENRMYFAVRIHDQIPGKGVLRLSQSLDSIESEMSSIYLRIVIAGAVIALLSVLAGLFISHRLTIPIEEMKRGAERFAAGDLGFRMAVPHSREMGSLAESINQMAAQLDERIRSIERQRSELDAVLSGMLEGVIAVDLEERVLSLNKAAAQLLGIDGSSAPGKILQEAARSAPLQKFLASTLSTGKTTEGEIVFHSDVDRILRVQVAPLRGISGRTSGAVVVVNDVTSLRKLESVRRDFVANVSHELKTPITAIKGSVETLLDGAMEAKEDAVRFLRIIARQSDRLSAIIEDLLLLSRVEQEGDTGAFELEEALVSRVLQNAVSVCAMHAQDKGIKIDLSCPEGLNGKINPPLLEQAVVNLIENAIKFSEGGSAVDVRAMLKDGGIAITVADEGCGIPEQHLSRIFERFYRVDKARSRQMGGTGLGLAIVKHIVQAHGGTVSVRSTVGKGSVFTIMLPA